MRMPVRHRLATRILTMLLLGVSTPWTLGEPLSGKPSGLLAERAAVPGTADANDARVAELSETIKANYRSVRAVVVLRGDLPIFEYFRDGTSPNDLLPVFSVTKSVMSILVGIALGQGAFSSLDQPLGELVPEALEPGVDPRVREITIRHLLTMTSGFDPDSSPMGVPSPSVLWRWSLRRPMLDAPGQRFNYDNQASHLVSVLLTRAIKQDPTHFAHQHLFAPLAIEKYLWPVDSEGHLQGASGLSLTARDMAKIGSLYLRGGRWNGRQLVPETYVSEGTRAPHNMGGPPVLAADYGYLWWITRPPGETIAYFAAGSGGQLIYVVPAFDLVIAIAGNASGAGGRRLINQAIIPAVRMQTLP